MAGDNLSEIRNKINRQKVYRSAKLEKAKAKLAKRKEQAQAEKLDPKLKEVNFHYSFSSQAKLTQPRND